jgi:hypothetical protein
VEECPADLCCVGSARHGVSSQSGDRTAAREEWPARPVCRLARTGQCVGRPVEWLSTAIAAVTAGYVWRLAGAALSHFLASRLKD